MSDPQDVYRTELTLPELASLDALNPAHVSERIRIVVPENGRVDDSRVKVLFPDGREEDMTNVLRVVIALEPTSCPQNGPASKPGTAIAMITRWNNEIGKLTYWVADCVLNYPQPLILIPN